MTPTAGRIAIVGGGVIGSSIAYHLVQDGYPGRVVVVERDATYARASSFLAMGGVRQQFSSAVNIRLAQYGARFYAAFDRAMQAPGHAPRADFRQRGYLFLVDEAASDRFAARLERQRRLGAHVRRMERDDIRRMAPDLRLDDIRFGVFGPDDGYGEPREVLAGFRAAAAAAGARYMTAEVVGLMRQSGRVAGVVLDDGERLAADVVVNAAGPFAPPARGDGRPRPAGPARAPAPVPLRPAGAPPLPPPDGRRPHRRALATRRRRKPRGTRPVVVARTRLDEPPGENFACDYPRWESDFRPPLQARMPGLAPIELIEGWAGLYAMTPTTTRCSASTRPLRGSSSPTATAATA